MVTGPDSAASWVVAGACCFINMMMFGMARLSGILFVASVDRFHIGRQQASFPYTFSSVTRNLSGPLVGYLGHKLGVRLVTTFGCLVAAAGIGGCYFAETISIVTVMYGVVFGLGFGLGNILLPVAINQYFDKHRATASGISFSGACIGSFVLPAIVEYLLDLYGLSGTFLIVAGIMLNCVPAAMLLRKPDFVIKSSNQDYKGNSEEKQCIVSDKKVTLYTIPSDHKPIDNKPQSKMFEYKTNYNPGTPERRMKPRLHVEKTESQTRTLSYEEKLKRLSTQTLISNYSIRMSSSEPLNCDMIIENDTAIRPIVPAIIESETSSVASQFTDDNEQFNEVFVDDAHSTDAIIQSCASPLKPAEMTTAIPDFPVSEVSYHNPSIDITKQHVPEYSKPDRISVIPTKNFNPYKNSYVNSAYQSDNLQICSQRDWISHSTDEENYYKRSINEDYKNNSHNDLYSNIAFEREFDNVVERQRSLPNIKFSDSSCDASEHKDTQRSAFLSLFIEPIFIIITVTFAFYCFTFVVVMTVIVDFARDIGIDSSNEKYLLMAFSIGDLIGRLGLGWITDRGYMTKTGFAATCFFFQGLSASAIGLSTGFPMLMMMISFYGLSEAGIIVMQPLVLAQYLGEDKQTVAIPSSLVLSGPICLAVAPLIGFFRDYIGSYVGMFYGIGLMSLLCCFLWMTIPCFAKKKI